MDKYPMANKTIKERIAILETLMQEIKEHFDNHISSHNKMFYLWFGLVITIVGKFLWEICMHLKG